MEHGSWIEYHPLTSVSDGSLIEFDVSGSGEDYINFANTMLYVKAKITGGRSSTSVNGDIAIQWEWSNLTTHRIQTP